jgi:cytochrome c556
MFRKITLVFAALAAMTGAATAAMDQEQAEKAAEVRQSVLTVIGWNVGPMAGMVKERMPYDPEQFKLHAERVAYMSTMLVEAFRPDTRGAVVETEALDNIWEDFGEFERLAGAMREKADALYAASGKADLQISTAAFLELGQSCKNCHDKFREDK